MEYLPKWFWFAEGGLILLGVYLGWVLFSLGEQIKWFAENGFIHPEDF